MKWNGVATGVTAGLQFVTLIVLARILAPADFGVMGMIMVVIGFAQAFADMGLSNAIIHRQDTSADQLSSLYWLNVLAGVGVFAVICAGAPLVVRFYHEPRLQNLLYLTALIFLITPLGQQFQILMQKELRFEGLAKTGIASAAANSVVAVTLAFGGFGVYSLIWGQLAGAAVKVVLLLKIGWGDWRPRFHYARRDIKGYASFGLYQMGERTINYFNANLDYLLIGSLLGAKALGYYTLAYNLIIRPTAMINPVITTVAFPVFAKMQHDRDGLKEGYLKVMQLLSFFNFPLMAGLAVVAPLAVPVVFGDQWLP
ncbi:MAG: colanic acid exporter, partial [Deltaproteobacteria bacterium]|nr:colanic acid exporter [Deltaproteobacteria bacterium]